MEETSNDSCTRNSSTKTGRSCSTRNGAVNDTPEFSRYSDNNLLDYISESEGHERNATDIVAVVRIRQDLNSTTHCTSYKKCHSKISENYITLLLCLLFFIILEIKASYLYNYMNF